MNASPDDWNTHRAVAADRVLVRMVDDTAVLLDSVTGRYFTLDRVGTRVWTLVTSLPSIAAACEALSGEFEAPPADVRQDVFDLLDQLAAAGLLEIQPA